MRYISFLEFLDFRILLKSFLGGRRCGRWWRDPTWTTKTSAAHPPARTYWGDCQRVFIFENEISGISPSQKSSADLYTTSSSMKICSFDLAVSSNVEPKTTWSKGFYSSSQKWQITYKFISDRAGNADCAPYIHLSFGTFEYNLCPIITYSYNQYIFWESLSDEVTNPSYLLHPSNNKGLTRRDLFMSFQKAVLGLIYSISSITPIPPNLSVPQLPSIPLFSFHQFHHIY